MHVDQSDRPDLTLARREGARAINAKSVSGAQQFTDNLVRKVLLWAFPWSVRPNHLTVVRFILTPVILLLLYYELRWWAFAVFIAAVCTDFIDGAMARTRDQITPIGIIIDPTADKILVGSVLAWTGYQYLVVQVILAFVVVEFLLMGIGLAMGQHGDRARPANTFGKAKMVLQSIALIMFLVAGILDLGPLITVSLYMLWVAIALTVFSGIKHIWDTFTEDKPRTGSRA